MSNSLNKRSKNFILENRKKELKTASKILSFSQVALVILGDLAAITIKSFWPHPYYHAFCTHRERSFSATINRLERNGLVKKYGSGDKFFILTKDGEKERQKALAFVELEKSKHKPWDGKWRLLIFDIPEKYKKYRDFLRTEIREYGFIKLQKSVWVSPFKAAEELKNTIEDMGMDRWVKLMIADFLFDDRELMAHFRLKR